MPSSQAIRYFCRHKLVIQLNCRKTEEGKKAENGIINYVFGNSLAIILKRY
jgi:hypothetical protein